MMRRVAFALACFTCSGHRHRLEASSEESRGTPRQHHQKAQKALATALLALNPAAGWHLGHGHGLAAEMPRAVRARLRVASLNGRTGRRHAGASMQAVPEDADDRFFEQWLFFDRSRIWVQAGNGGDGCSAMLREKDRPKLGPGGGDGGRGGHVYLECDEGLNTLKPEIHHKGSRGQHGMGKCRDGFWGEDCYVKVPPGTVVRDAETGGLVGELLEHGEKLRVAKGGKGGKGNKSFKTPRNSLPHMAERGQLGAQRWLRLELKLVADVGFVGCPNAGKSTLLAATTRAAPKIDSYPFTTVAPNLGVWRSPNPKDYDADSSFVIADIPGLLEGAHDGVGLGIAFLRHIERCRLLVHVVDGSSADPVGDYEAIIQELKLFSPWLAKKPNVIVLNKIDIPEVKEMKDEIVAELKKSAGHNRVMCVSAATTESCATLMQKLRKLLTRAKLITPLEKSDEPLIVLDPDKLSDEIHIIPDGPDAWRVSGDKLENAAAMTNWDYHESQLRFQRIMKALGVDEKLKAAGAKNGDVILIGRVDFVYFEESPMAARARLAGFMDYADRLKALPAEERVELGLAPYPEGVNLAEFEKKKEEQKQLDKELDELLASAGDVIMY